MYIGQVILGRYQVLESIGEGGQATVAKGYDLQTRQFVAIKKLGTTPGQPGYQQELARFLRAAQLRIGHPAVVDPITHGQEGFDWYMVMPYIEGSDLWNYVHANGGRLSVAQAASFARQMAEGLGAIHAQGLLHRDVKPPNALIRQDMFLFLCDLGICRNMCENTITAGSVPIGTPLWMSPEQILRPDAISSLSDLYSLGGVFYWMLTGCEPAKGHDVATVMLSVCQGQLTPPCMLDASIPAHISQACMKLLAKEEGRRFRTATDFIQALDASNWAASQPAVGSCFVCASPLAPLARFCQQCGTMQSSGKTMVHCLACGAPAEHDIVCPSCSRVFMYPDHRLRFTIGDLAGREFRFPLGDYYVGRQQFLDLDPCISRRHMRVECTNAGPTITDAGSANKTYVAGMHATFPVMLFAGCTVNVASNSAVVITN